MNLPQLDADKANHYVWGTGAAVAGSFAAPFVGLPPAAGAMIGSTAAGVAKEAIDWVLNKLAARRGQVKLHTVDPMDMVWTAAGGVPVALAVGL